jgi:serine/threonine protein kinase
MGNTASGVGAYKIKLIPENKLGGGQYADVYKIKKKATKEWYAAKFLKVPMLHINSLEKMGYDRELQILKETNHPFVIKYQDEFIFKGAAG